MEEIVETAQVIKNALDDNPEIRLVLEIAARARDLESRKPPRNIGVTTDIVVTPTNSQCLVPPETAGQPQTA